MKNSKTTILAMAFIGLTIMSCKDGKKEQTIEESHTEMNHDTSDGHHDSADSEMEHDNMNKANTVMNSSSQSSSDAKQVLADYMILKDALVATNKEKAATAGKKLESSLSTFNLSNYSADEQKELKDIIVDAKEHAEHIGKSEMDHQREHFKILSKDMMDMVAITGTATTLYQQFCPMYDKGSAWLSMSKDIENPYYGSQMLNCGRVEKEIK